MKNNIVIFGGYSSNKNRNNVLNIYNLATRTWSQKELQGEANKIPKPRSRHTANVVGNYIIIIGGYGSFGGDKNVYQIDFDTQECQIIGNITDPIYNHTANVYK